VKKLLLPILLIFSISAINAMDLNQQEQPTENNSSFAENKEEYTTRLLEAPRMPATAGTRVVAGNTTHVIVCCFCPFMCCSNSRAISRSLVHEKRRG
jgi:hypothetical protein